MRATISEHFDLADATADALLIRRLTNAGLSLLAPWLLVLALSGWENRFIAETWLMAVAIAVSAGSLGFAAWTVLAGDRKAWRDALAAAVKSDRHG